ncbi:MAG: hypothetical protein IKZ19_03235 [Clostridia bacterium]|nr:hypothetical protein [Clostridia bacterium]
MENLKIYPASVFETEKGSLSLAKGTSGEFIIAPAGLGFTGTEENGVVTAPANAENAEVLRSVLPFTAPTKVLTRDKSFGFGDRLGLAGTGHIRALGKSDVAPVLAQQSMRELNLTRRTYSDVLNAATYSVLREGYTKGFGADGDHLKTSADIKAALDLGFTMITLDASEHIHSEPGTRSDPTLEAFYLGRAFENGGSYLTFTPEELGRIAYVYGEAIDFAADIWREHFLGKNTADFEMSIDETKEPTDPKAHFFCACELMRRGVLPATMAPRFCGDFQKGIDYIGDKEQFQRELTAHAAIARRFGYKLSIHSGSDKFSVFPYIGRELERWHVKTAGTSWLEAMKVVSMKDPALFRECWALALEAFPHALAYYHITSDPTTLAPIETLSDEQLPELFKDDTARQLIHITYGQLLTSPNLGEKLFSLWDRFPADYAEALVSHLGRHLELLGVEI